MINCKVVLLGDMLFIFKTACVTFDSLRTVALLWLRVGR